MRFLTRSARNAATAGDAGYLSIDKDFVGKKPRTRIAISKAGLAALREHMRYLREIIEASES